MTNKLCESVAIIVKCGLLSLRTKLKTKLLMINKGLPIKIIQAWGERFMIGTQ